MNAKLRRVLSLVEVVFFASGVILGAGIYAIIGETAAFGGNMLWLSLLIASVTALMTVFSYAELCAMYPRAGGEFEYVKSSLGRKMAFVVGPLVTLTGIVSGATVAVGFAGYLSELLATDKLISAISLIAFILLVNLSGIKLSSRINIIFTIIEVGGLLFIIYTAIPSLGKVDYFKLPEQGFNGLLVASALSFFAFTGFEDVVKLAEETKEPEKNIPKALFISLSIIITLYIAIAIAAVSVVDYRELGDSESPLSKVAESRWGSVGATVIACIALFSTSNTVLSNMLGGSRILYTMGDENKRLRIFSKLSAKKATPVIALPAVAILMAAFAVIGNIKTIALLTNFFVFGTFLLINISVLYLRIKEPGRPRPFKVPLNIRNIPVMTITGILLLLLMLAYTVYGLSI